jgi:hypothetical protein
MTVLVEKEILAYVAVDRAQFLYIIIDYYLK